MSTTATSSEHQDNDMMERTAVVDRAPLPPQ